MTAAAEPARAPIIVTALFGDGDNGWLQELRRAHYPAERNQVPAHLTLFHHLPPIDLGEGTALRVDSDELEDMRHDLAEALRGLLTPQDMAPWRPHVTIQNKVEPREARRLQAQLRASFEPRPLSIRGLASWRYLGGPWERVKAYTFRG
jgi:hypothetical protein